MHEALERRAVERILQDQGASRREAQIASKSMTSRQRRALIRDAKPLLVRIKEAVGL